MANITLAGAEMDEDTVRKGSCWPAASATDESKFDTIRCMFCGGIILYNGVAAVRYKDHLIKEHNIMDGWDFVIKKTLILNQKIASLDASTQTDAAVQPVAVQQPNGAVANSTTTALPWYEGCEYQCRYDECGDMFYSSRLLRSHIKSYHCSPDEYIEAYSSFESKVAHLACRLCRKQIKQNESAFAGHLNNEHDGMTLEGYRVAFGLPEGQSAKKRTMKVDGSPPPTKKKKKEKNHDVEPVVVVDKMEAAAAAAATIGTTRRSRKISWFLGCEYACKMPGCGALFFYVEELRAHVEKKHCHPDQYADRFGTYESKPVFMDCGLCGASIKKSFNSVRGHLGDKHDQMTFKEYRNLFDIPREVDAPVHDGGGEEENDGKRKWFEGCEFECRICASVFLDDRELVRHFELRHGVTEDQYVKNFDKLKTKAATYVCKICRCKMDHQLSTIKSHVSTNHSLNFDHYAETFHEGPPDGKGTGRLLEQPNNGCEMEFAEESLNGCEEVEESNEIEVLEVENGNDDDVEEEEEEDDDDDDDDDDDGGAVKGDRKAKGDRRAWMNRCTFKCHVCKKAPYASKGLLARHVTREHNLGMKLYKDKYGPDSYHVKQYHSCRVCGEKVLWTAVPLANHVRRHMKAASYFNKFMLGGKQTTVDDGKAKGDDKALANGYTCAICGKNVKPSLKGLATHLSKAHCLTVKDYRKNYVKKVGKSKEQLPWEEGANGSSRRVPFRPKLKRKPKTFNFRPKLSAKDDEFKAWKDMCKFSCLICDGSYSVNSLFAVRAHVRVKHGKKVEEFDSSLMSVEEDFHDCELCGDRILHSAKELKEHFETKHDLRLISYFQECVKGRGAAKSDVEIRLKEWLSSKKAFSCGSCDFTGKNCRSLMTHRFKAHNKWRDGKHPLVDSVPRHKCLVCGANIKLDEAAMKEHVGQHGVTLTGYFEDFIKGGGGREGAAADAMPSIVNVRSVGQDPVPEDEDISTDADAASHVYPDALDSVKEEGGLGWMDSCMYKCEICSNVFSKKRVFESHLDEAHSLSYETYLRANGNSMIVQKLQPCMICKAMVVSDAEEIAGHLQDLHSIGPQEYYETYLKQDVAVVDHVEN